MTPATTDPYVALQQKWAQPATPSSAVSSSDPYAELARKWGPPPPPRAPRGIIGQVGQGVRAVGDLAGAAVRGFLHGLGGGILTSPQLTIKALSSAVSSGSLGCRPFEAATAVAAEAAVNGPEYQAAFAAIEPETTPE